MESITLKYNSCTGAESRTISVLSVKGFDPIDDVSDFPDILHPIIDGSLIHQTIGIHRHITIEFDIGFTQVYANRLFLANFWKDPIKKLTYTHDGITETDLQVVRSSGNLKSDYQGGIQLARKTIFELDEQYLITTFPS
jgi:hypothetical protein